MAIITDLPQDVLILICLNIDVEDVLALMQTCRVMYSLGSLDYLWRRLLSGRDWDIPIDVPLNASFASLSSNVLREAAVKALKLDKRWRDPRLEARRAQRIIAQNSSFVDGMRLLPGGRWLVTLQYEQTIRTHITLWSTGDLDDCRAVFKTTVPGRVRFLHAHHHHESEQITIGIVYAYSTAESIRVYDVCLPDDSLTRYSLIFEATPNELHSMGRIGGMKINGEVMIVVFASTPSWESRGQGQVVCINLVSKVAAVLDCPDWSLALGHLKLFRRYFAVTASRFVSARISFYRLPSVVLDHPKFPLPTSQCWPEKVVIKSSPDASTAWHLDYPLVVELSDDIPTNTMEDCSFTILGHPVSTHPSSGTRVDLLRVSFDGCKIECVPTSVPCRSIPCAEGVRLSSSGRRAVWLYPRSDTHECTLVKFARESSNLSSCVSTLMPSFSGLPFNPCDFHLFAFDEISCRIAVALSSGELYMLHF